MGLRNLVIVVILLLLPTALSQERGFVSINCGGSSFTSLPEGLLWKTDDRSPRSDGVAATINMTSVPKELQTLRYFPAATSSIKSCYSVTVPQAEIILSQQSTAAGVPYLVRLGFLYGNYDGLNRPPSFNVSLNGDLWASLELQAGDDPVYLETTSLFPGTGATIYLCVIRLNDSESPFVNSIELRPLPELGYVYGHEYHHLVLRVNFGGPTIRYPLDEYDRLWLNYLDTFPELGKLEVLNTSNKITDGNRPPDVVMQTAVTNSTISFTFNPIFFGGSAVQAIASFTTDPIFYFDGNSIDQVGKFGLECSDLFEPLGVETRKDTALQFSVAKFLKAYPAFSSSAKSTTCRLTRNTLDPVISAVEMFTVQEKTNSTTYIVDDTALAKVGTDFQLKSLWVGDPCLPVPWDALQCQANSTFYQVSAMDLSGRNLTGNISSSIASLQSLKFLNLSNNNLDGSFPDWLEYMPSLTSLDVSNNLLTGTVPLSLAIKLGTNLRYDGNPDLICSFLCGQATGPEGRESAKRGFDKGIIILGALLAVALIGLTSLMVVGYRVFISNSSTNGFFDKDYRELQKRLRSQGAKAQPLSLAKVKKATKNFRKKIGEGGFGPVYYGILEDGQEVAVKVLSTKSSQGGEEFYNEIELLSLVHHRHLVSLLGYCRASKSQILVYEYMKGGDVYNRLHGKTAQSNPLTWKERKSIIIEVAEGLEYLHQGCSLCIIHRDIKSKNILLTDATRAKVADFGLSRLKSMDEQDATHVTTSVKGTTGYMDPEYYITNKLTEKSDVYGFGVLVMEIICGRAPVVRSLPLEQMHIADAVRTAWKAESVQDIADPNLQGDYEKPILYNIINLALWCVEQTSKRRPSMTEVVHELRQTGLETSLSLNWNLRDMPFCSCGQSNCEHQGQQDGSSSFSGSSVSEASIELRICSRPGEYDAVQAACSQSSPAHVESATSLTATRMVNRPDQGWIAKLYAQWVPHRR